MNSELRAQPATTADQEFLAQMIVLTTWPITGLAGRDGGELLTMARLEISQWQPDRYIVAIAWQNDERVGAVWLRGAGEATARYFTLGLAVVPDHQRQGVGAFLMEYALDFCRRNGGRQVHLKVHPNNEAALRLYRRFGFEVTNLDMKLSF